MTDEYPNKRPLNIYRISQEENDYWDTYDSAIVAALSEEEAKTIHPCYYDANWKDPNGGQTWTHPKNIKVELIGKAAPHIEKGIILTSFNAG